MCGLQYVKLSPEFNYYIIPMSRVAFAFWHLDFTAPETGIPPLTPKLESDC